jgi:hypothetical protein
LEEVFRAKQAPIHPLFDSNRCRFETKNRKLGAVLLQILEKLSAVLKQNGFLCGQKSLLNSCFTET